MSQIKKHAIDLLSRREHAAQELCQKLCKKGHPKQDVLMTIESLQEAGWQSDFRYAECRIRSRAHKGYGPRFIEQELGNQGVSADIIAEAMRACEINWDEKAREVWLKKFKQDAIDAKTRMTQLRYMHYRGFDGIPVFS